MFYIKTSDIKAGSTILELANETTASSYLYATSPQVAQMLDEMDEEELGTLMPAQAPGSMRFERGEIAFAVCDAARARNIPEEDIWCDSLPIEAKWFESGWKSSLARKWPPAAFNVGAVEAGFDTSEYELAAKYSACIPSSYYVWGFGKDEKHCLWCIVVDLPEEEDVDEQLGEFTAYRYVGNGIFKRTCSYIGYDKFFAKTSLDFSITWNPDADLVIDYAIRIAEESKSGA